VAVEVDLSYLPKRDSRFLNKVEPRPLWNKSRNNKITEQPMTRRSRHLLCVAALGVWLHAPLAAGADGVPKLNAEPSCRAAADAAAMGALPGANMRDLASCMRDEDEARDTLSNEWVQFSERDKQRCVSETQTGGSPSYVELLVCLEMIRDASGQDNPLPINPTESNRNRRK
jgi:hypothetical protein